MFFKTPEDMNSIHIYIYKLNQISEKKNKNIIR